MQWIDVRSDTVTQPTAAMREAMFKAEVGDDVYGDDPTVRQLEELAAEKLGKEAALLVPTGNFGNQLALLTHCQRGNEVILGDDCHIVWHETGGAAVIGMLTGRKRSISSTLSKNRMASSAKDKLEAEETTLEQYKDQLAELMRDKEALVKEVTEKWQGVADEVTEITVKPTKSDIFSDIFAVVWLPYYIVDQNGKKMELPAFRR